jgi:2-amino-4-hydroxy-6-hydroxymethyldihydropteridine diphosphokinase
MVHSAYIALGSNLCDPITQINNAFSALDQLPRTQLIKQSSLYQSEPFGYDNQPDFINAVAEVSTDLSPEVLLKELLSIENTFGRERPFPNAPRILDLDLLLYGDVSQKTTFLTLPHPQMHLRSFVILPLAEIAPDLVISSDDIIPKRCNVVELAQSFQNEKIVKLNNHHPA